MHLEKLAEKQNQHRKLVGALEQRGFNVKPMIFVFGVGGNIYKQSVEDMRQLGVSSTAITKTLKEVHVHSVTCAANIITRRRVLDSQKLLQTQTATLDHHPHNNPAFSQGLAWSVSLLIDSMTNA